jgi:spore maturation protein CgeB
LNHPAEAEAIRKKGYARALKDHSWEMRFDKLFHILGLLR